MRAEREATSDADTARALMAAFAERTGLDPPRTPSVRYLWTDAFAVCNFLGFARASGDDNALALTRRLVDAVHATLGAREPHPTAGGLRIGKPLAERGVDEPFDTELERDRDGQYFHYLTKWMHALDQTGRITGDAKYRTWARELAKAAHRAFVYSPRAGFPKRMYWKMSVDLSRPLVRAMGQHDPLDAWITYHQLGGHGLDEEIADVTAMCEDASWATDEALGLGGLLCDASRVMQLTKRGAVPGTTMLVALLEAALDGLARFAGVFDVHGPAQQRLAFRELGLAIGLAGLDRVCDSVERDAELSRSAVLCSRLDQIAVYSPLRDAIVSFWMDPAHRRTPSYLAHRDIDDVMLATSLAPDGFLALG